MATRRHRVGSIRPSANTTAYLRLPDRRGARRAEKDSRQRQRQRAGMPAQRHNTKANVAAAAGPWSSGVARTVVNGGKAGETSEALSMGSVASDGAETSGHCQQPHEPVKDLMAGRLALLSSLECPEGGFGAVLFRQLFEAEPSPTASGAFLRSSSLLSSTTFQAEALGQIFRQRDGDAKQTATLQSAAGTSRTEGPEDGVLSVESPGEDGKARAGAKEDLSAGDERPAEQRRHMNASVERRCGSIEDSSNSFADWCDTTGDTTGGIPALFFPPQLPQDSGVASEGPGQEAATADLSSSSVHVAADASAIMAIESWARGEALAGNGDSGHCKARSLNSSFQRRSAEWADMAAAMEDLGSCLGAAPSGSEEAAQRCETPPLDDPVMGRLDTPASAISVAALCSGSPQFLPKECTAEAKETRPRDAACCDPQGLNLLSSSAYAAGKCVKHPVEPAEVEAELRHLLGITETEEEIELRTSLELSQVIADLQQESLERPVSASSSPRLVTLRELKERHQHRPEQQGGAGQVSPDIGGFEVSPAVSAAGLSYTPEGQPQHTRRSSFDNITPIWKRKERLVEKGLELPAVEIRVTVPCGLEQSAGAEVRTAPTSSAAACVEDLDGAPGGTWVSSQADPSDASPPPSKTSTASGMLTTQFETPGGSHQNDAFRASAAAACCPRASTDGDSPRRLQRTKSLPGGTRGSFPPVAAGEIPRHAAEGHFQHQQGVLTAPRQEHLSAQEVVEDALAPVTWSTGEPDEDFWQSSASGGGSFLRSISAPIWETSMASIDTDLRQGDPISGTASLLSPPLSPSPSTPLSSSPSSTSGSSDASFNHSSLAGRLRSCSLSKTGSLPLPLGLEDLAPEEASSGDPALPTPGMKPSGIPVIPRLNLPVREPPGHTRTRSAITPDGRCSAWPDARVITPRNMTPRVETPRSGVVPAWDANPSFLVVPGARRRSAGAASGRLPPLAVPSEEPSVPTRDHSSEPTLMGGATSGQAGPSSFSDSVLKNMPAAPKSPSHVLPEPNASTAMLNSKHHPGAPLCSPPPSGLSAEMEEPVRRSELRERLPMQSATSRPSSVSSSARSPERAEALVVQEAGHCSEEDPVSEGHSSSLVLHEEVSREGAGKKQDAEPGPESAMQLPIEASSDFSGLVASFPGSTAQPSLMIEGHGAENIGSQSLSQEPLARPFVDGGDSQAFEARQTAQHASADLPFLHIGGWPSEGNMAPCEEEDKEMCGEEQDLAITSQSADAAGERESSNSWSLLAEVHSPDSSLPVTGTNESSAHYQDVSGLPSQRAALPPKLQTAASPTKLQPPPPAICGPSSPLMGTHGGSNSCVPRPEDVSTSAVDNFRAVARKDPRLEAVAPSRLPGPLSSSSGTPGVMAARDTQPAFSGTATLANHGDPQSEPEDGNAMAQTSVVMGANQGPIAQQQQPSVADASEATASLVSYESSDGLAAVARRDSTGMLRVPSHPHQTAGAGASAGLQGSDLSAAVDVQSESPATPTLTACPFPVAPPPAARLLLDAHDTTRSEPLLHESTEPADASKAVYCQSSMASSFTGDSLLTNEGDREASDALTLGGSAAPLSEPMHSESTACSPRESRKLGSNIHGRSQSDTPLKTEITPEGSFDLGGPKPEPAGQSNVDHGSNVLLPGCSLGTMAAEPEFAACFDGAHLLHEAHGQTGTRGVLLLGGDEEDGPGPFQEPSAERRLPAGLSEATAAAGVVHYPDSAAAVTAPASQSQHHSHIGDSHGGVSLSRIPRAAASNLDCPAAELLGFRPAAFPLDEGGEHPYGAPGVSADPSRWQTPRDLHSASPVSSLTTPEVLSRNANMCRSSFEPPSQLPAGGESEAVTGDSVGNADIIKAVNSVQLAKLLMQGAALRRSIDGDLSGVLQPGDSSAQVMILQAAPTSPPPQKHYHPGSDSTRGGREPASKVGEVCGTAAPQQEVDASEGAVQSSLGSMSSILAAASTLRDSERTADSITAVESVMTAEIFMHNEAPRQHVQGTGLEGLALQGAEQRRLPEAALLLSSAEPQDTLEAFLASSELETPCMATLEIVQPAQADVMPPQGQAGHTWADLEAEASGCLSDPLLARTTLAVEEEQQQQSVKRKARVPGSEMPSFPGECKQQQSQAEALSQTIPDAMPAPAAESKIPRRPRDRPRDTRDKSSAPLAGLPDDGPARRKDLEMRHQAGTVPPPALQAVSGKEPSNASQGGCANDTGAVASRGEDPSLRSFPCAATEPLTSSPDPEANLPPDASTSSNSGLVLSVPPAEGIGMIPASADVPDRDPPRRAPAPGSNTVSRSTEPGMQASVSEVPEKEEEIDESAILPGADRQTSFVSSSDTVRAYLPPGPIEQTQISGLPDGRQRHLQNTKAVPVQGGGSSGGAAAPAWEPIAPAASDSEHIRHSLSDEVCDNSADSFRTAELLAGVDSDAAEVLLNLGVGSLSREDHEEQLPRDPEGSPVTSPSERRCGGVVAPASGSETDQVQPSAISRLPLPVEGFLDVRSDLAARMKDESEWRKAIGEQADQAAIDTVGSREDPVHAAQGAHGDIRVSGVSKMNGNGEAESLLTSPSSQSKGQLRVPTCAEGSFELPVHEASETSILETIGYFVDEEAEASSGRMPFIQQPGKSPNNLMTRGDVPTPVENPDVASVKERLSTTGTVNCGLDSAALGCSPSNQHSAGEPRAGAAGSVKLTPEDTSLGRQSFSDTLDAKQPSIAAPVEAADSANPTFGDARESMGFAAVCPSGLPQEDGVCAPDRAADPRFDQSPDDNISQAKAVPLEQRRGNDVLETNTAQLEGRRQGGGESSDPSITNGPVSTGLLVPETASEEWCEKESALPQRCQQDEDGILDSKPLRRNVSPKVSLASERHNLTAVEYPRSPPSESPNTGRGGLEPLPADRSADLPCSKQGETVVVQLMTNEQEDPPRQVQGLSSSGGSAKNTLKPEASLTRVGLLYPCGAEVSHEVEGQDERAKDGHLLPNASAVLSEDAHAAERGTSAASPHLRDTAATSGTGFAHNEVGHIPGKQAASQDPDQDSEYDSRSIGADNVRTSDLHGAEGSRSEAAAAVPSDSTSVPGTLVLARGEDREMPRPKTAMQGPTLSSKDDSGSIGVDTVHPADMHAVEEGGSVAAALPSDLTSAPGALMLTGDEVGEMPGLTTASLGPCLSFEDDSGSIKTNAVCTEDLQVAILGEGSSPAVLSAPNAGEPTTCGPTMQGRVLPADLQAAKDSELATAALPGDATSVPGALMLANDEADDVPRPRASSQEPDLSLEDNDELVASGSVYTEDFLMAVLGDKPSATAAPSTKSDEVTAKISDLVSEAGPVPSEDLHASHEVTSQKAARLSETAAAPIALMLANDEVDEVPMLRIARMDASLSYTDDDGEADTSIEAGPDARADLRAVEESGSAAATRQSNEAAAPGPLMLANDEVHEIPVLDCARQSLSPSRDGSIEAGAVRAAELLSLALGKEDATAPLSISTDEEQMVKVSDKSPEAVNDFATCAHPVERRESAAVARPADVPAQPGVLMLTQDNVTDLECERQGISPRSEEEDEEDSVCTTDLIFATLGGEASSAAAYSTRIDGGQTTGAEPASLRVAVEEIEEELPTQTRDKERGLVSTSASTDPTGTSYGNAHQDKCGKEQPNGQPRDEHSGTDQVEQSVGIADMVLQVAKAENERPDTAVHTFDARNSPPLSPGASSAELVPGKASLSMAARQHSSLEHIAMQSVSDDGMAVCERNSVRTADLPAATLKICESVSSESNDDSGSIRTAELLSSDTAVQAAAKLLMEAAASAATKRHKALGQRQTNIDCRETEVDAGAEAELQASLKENAAVVPTSAAPDPAAGAVGFDRSAFSISSSAAASHGKPDPSVSAPGERSLPGSPDEDPDSVRTAELLFADAVVQAAATLLEDAAASAAARRHDTLARDVRDDVGMESKRLPVPAVELLTVAKANEAEVPSSVVTPDPAWTSAVLDGPISKNLPWLAASPEKFPFLPDAEGKSSSGNQGGCPGSAQLEFDDFIVEAAAKLLEEAAASVNATQRCDPRERVRGGVSEHAKNQPSCVRTAEGITEKSAQNAQISGSVVHPSHGATHQSDASGESSADEDEDPDSVRTAELLYADATVEAAAKLLREASAAAYARQREAPQADNKAGRDVSEESTVQTAELRVAGQGDTAAAVQLRGTEPPRVPESAEARIPPVPASPPGKDVPRARFVNEDKALHSASKTELPPPEAAMEPASQLVDKIGSTPGARQHQHPEQQADSDGGESEDGSARTADLLAAVREEADTTKETQGSESPKVVPPAISRIPSAPGISCRKELLGAGAVHEDKAPDTARTSEGSAAKPLEVGAARKNLIEAASLGTTQHKSPEQQAGERSADDEGSAVQVAEVHLAVKGEELTTKEPMGSGPAKISDRTVSKIPSVSASCRRANNDPSPGSAWNTERPPVEATVDAAPKNLNETSSSAAAWQHGHWPLQSKNEDADSEESEGSSARTSELLAASEGKAVPAAEPVGSGPYSVLTATAAARSLELKTKQAGSDGEESEGSSVWTAELLAAVNKEVGTTAEPATSEPHPKVPDPTVTRIPSVPGSSSRKNLLEAGTTNTDDTLNSVRTIDQLIATAEAAPQNFNGMTSPTAARLPKGQAQQAGDDASDDEGSSVRTAELLAVVEDKTAAAKKPPGSEQPKTIVSRIPSVAASSNKDVALANKDVALDVTRVNERPPSEAAVEAACKNLYESASPSAEMQYGAQAQQAKSEDTDDEESEGSSARTAELLAAVNGEVVAAAVQSTDSEPAKCPDNHVGSRIPSVTESSCQNDLPAAMTGEAMDHVGIAAMPLTGTSDEAMANPVSNVNSSDAVKQPEEIQANSCVAAQKPVLMSKLMAPVEKQATADHQESRPNAASGTSGHFVSKIPSAPSVSRGVNPSREGLAKKDEEPDWVVCTAEQRPLAMDAEPPSSPRRSHVASPPAQDVVLSNSPGLSVQAPQMEMQKRDIHSILQAYPSETAVAEALPRLVRDLQAILDSYATASPSAAGGETPNGNDAQRDLHAVLDSYAPRSVPPELRPGTTSGPVEPSPALERRLQGILNVYAGADALTSQVTEEEGRAVRIPSRAADELLAVATDAETTGELLRMALEALSEQDGCRGEEPAGSWFCGEPPQPLAIPETSATAPPADSQPFEVGRWDHVAADGYTAERGSLIGNEGGFLVEGAVVRDVPAARLCPLVQAVEAEERLVGEASRQAMPDGSVSHVGQELLLSKSENDSEPVEEVDRSDEVSAPAGVLWHGGITDLKAEESPVPQQQGFHKFEDPEEEMHSAHPGLEGLDDGSQGSAAAGVLWDDGTVALQRAESPSPQQQSFRSLDEVQGDRDGEEEMRSPRAHLGVDDGSQGSAGADEVWRNAEEVQHEGGGQEVSAFAGIFWHFGILRGCFDLTQGDEDGGEERCLPRPGMHVDDGGGEVSAAAGMQTLGGTVPLQGEKSPSPQPQGSRHCSDDLEGKHRGDGQRISHPCLESDYGGEEERFLRPGFHGEDAGEEGRLALHDGIAAVQGEQSLSSEQHGFYSCLDELQDDEDGKDESHVPHPGLECEDEGLQASEVAGVLWHEGIAALKGEETPSPQQQGFYIRTDGLQGDEEEQGRHVPHSGMEGEDVGEDSPAAASVLWHSGIVDLQGEETPSPQPQGFRSYLDAMQGAEDGKERHAHPGLADEDGREEGPAAAGVLWREGIVALQGEEGSSPQPRGFRSCLDALHGEDAGEESHIHPGMEDEDGREEGPASADVLWRDGIVALQGEEGSSPQPRGFRSCLDALHGEDAGEESHIHPGLEVEDGRDEGPAATGVLWREGIVALQGEEGSSPQPRGFRSCLDALHGEDAGEESHIHPGLEVEDAGGVSASAGVLWRDGIAVLQGEESPSPQNQGSRMCSDELQDVESMRIPLPRPVLEGMTCGEDRHYRPLTSEDDQHCSASEEKKQHCPVLAGDIGSLDIQDALSEHDHLRDSAGELQLLPPFANDTAIDDSIRSVAIHVIATTGAEEGDDASVPTLHAGAEDDAEVPTLHGVPSGGPLQVAAAELGSTDPAEEKEFPIPCHGEEGESSIHFAISEEDEARQCQLSRQTTTSSGIACIDRMALILEEEHVETPSNRGLEAASSAAGATSPIGDVGEQEERAALYTHASPAPAPDSSFAARQETNAAARLLSDSDEDNHDEQVKSLYLTAISDVSWYNGIVLQEEAEDGEPLPLFFDDAHPMPHPGSNSPRPVVALNSCNGASELPEAPRPLESRVRCYASPSRDLAADVEEKADGSQGMAEQDQEGHGHAGASQGAYELGADAFCQRELPSVVPSCYNNGIQWRDGIVLMVGGEELEAAEGSPMADVSERLRVMLAAPDAQAADVDAPDQLRALDIADPPIGKLGRSDKMPAESASVGEALPMQALCSLGKDEVPETAVVWNAEPGHEAVEPKTLKPMKESTGSSLLSSGMRPEGGVLKEELQQEEAQLQLLASTQGPVEVSQAVGSSWTAKSLGSPAKSALGLQAPAPALEATDKDAGSHLRPEALAIHAELCDIVECEALAAEALVEDGGPISPSLAPATKSPAHKHPMPLIRPLPFNTQLPEAEHGAPEKEAPVEGGREAIYAPTSPASAGFVVPDIRWDEDDPAAHVPCAATEGAGKGGKAWELIEKYAAGGSLNSPRPSRVDEAAATAAQARTPSLPVAGPSGLAGSSLEALPVSLPSSPANLADEALVMPPSASPSRALPPLSLGPAEVGILSVDPALHDASLAANALSEYHFLDSIQEGGVSSLPESKQAQTGPSLANPGRPPADQIAARDGCPERSSAIGLNGSSALLLPATMSNRDSPGGITAILETSIHGHPTIQAEFLGAVSPSAPVVQAFEYPPATDTPVAEAEFLGAMSPSSPVVQAFEYPSARETLVTGAEFLGEVSPSAAVVNAFEYPSAREHPVTGAEFLGAVSPSAPVVQDFRGSFCQRASCHGGRVPWRRVTFSTCV